MDESIEEKAAEAMEAKEVASIPVEKQEVIEAKVESRSVARVVPKDIVVEDGKFVPSTLTEATRIAEGLLKTGCIPAQFKTVPQVLMAQQFLRQLGLPDIACLPRIAIIKGSYSLWGEGPKAVCQPEIEDFEEFWFDAEYKIISFGNKNLTAVVSGAVCRVKRKGIPTCVERVFTVDDAKTAGLWSKDGPWKQYPDRMLQMRARSWALKDAFPDKLMGLDIAEYDHDSLVDAAIEAGANQAPKLAERFK
jgi:hypothetical protein